MSFDARSGCAAPRNYTVDVTLTRVEKTSGFCLACLYTTYIKGMGLPSTFQTGVFGPTTGPQNFSNHKSVSLSPGQSMSVCSEFDVAAACMLFGCPEAVSGSTNNVKALADRSEATFTNSVNSVGASARFTWKVKKSANY